MIWRRRRRRKNPRDDVLGEDVCCGVRSKESSVQKKKTLSSFLEVYLRIMYPGNVYIPT